jgi:hypothetical protein
MPPTEKPPVTDSPWLWVLLFAVVGLILLGVISGQYGKRQARLERQYQARERIADDELGDEAAADPARRAYSSPEKTLVPIWPLAVLLGGTIVLSAVMLGRELQRRSP